MGVEETKDQCQEQPDEGCTCAEGKVENNGKCVPEEDCLKPTCSYPMGDLDITMNVSWFY